jgi:hypothetical protein
LDTIPASSNLPTMQEMILDIKSTKFPHISLIHSIDRTWSHMSYWRDFIYIYMPHLADEAEIMMQNLLTFLRHKYGDDILLYFTKEAKEEAQGDKWNSKNNRVLCATDKFIEEDIDDI